MCNQLRRRIWTQLRQKQHFVDVDSRAHDVLQYSMGATGDRLSSIPLRSFPGLTPTSAAAATQADSAFETYSSCAAKDVGTPCMDLVFAWAPQFRDQVGVCKRASLSTIIPLARVSSAMLSLRERSACYTTRIRNGCAHPQRVCANRWR
jgi:hypothetical protein